MRLIAASLLFLAYGTSLQANLTQTLQSVNIVGPNTYLIDSDANNGLFYYNRDSIRSSVNMEYSRSGGAGYHYWYRFDFQLLDGAGQAQTLNLGGSTGATLSVYEDVDMTVGDATINRSTSANLRPSFQLSPYEEYKVRVRVYRSLSQNGLYTNLSLSDETVQESFIHFDQLLSGDNAYNVISELESVTWNRIYRVQSEPARDHFRVNAHVRLYRYDGFGQAISVDEITTRVTVVLRDDEGTLIPLEQSTFEFTNNLASYLAGNGQIFIPNSPSTVLSQRILELVPTQQLASRSRTYNVQVTVGHYEAPGAAFPTAGNNLTTANTRLLDFNGSIQFAGGAEGTFTSTTTPAPLVENLGSDYVLTTLRINNNSGSFKGMIFGNGDPLSVELRDSGIASLESGFISMNGTGIPDSPGKILFSIQGLVATPTGMTGNVNLRLPSGLGVGVDAVTRIYDPNLFFFNINLDPDLSPSDAILTDAQIRWAAEESKPFIFEVAALAWDVDLDRIRLFPTGNAVYVRGKFYDTLLADPFVPASQRFKLGNDAYYWKMNGISSVEVLVEPHPVNGSALMTCDIDLGGSLYHGHFPYDVLISASGGSQRIVQDLVDSSFGGLTGVSSVKLLYARDCPDGDCGGAVGLETLTLLPENDELKFTRDGGLAASGVMNAATTLTWGWVDVASDYAQSSGSFLDAGFLASGVFLAGDEYA
jgi:hypothetical protein